MVGKTADPLIQIKAVAPITIFFSAMNSQLKGKGEGECNFHYKAVKNSNFDIFNHE